MKCVKCKNEIPKESRYCLHCGEKQLSPGKIKNIKKTQANKSSSDNILIVAILIAGSIIAFYFLYPESPKQSQGASPVMPNQNQYQDLSGIIDQLKNDPFNYSLLVQAGNMYFDIEKFSNAIQYYEQALLQNSSQPEVIIDAGVCYFNLKQLDKAEEYFRKALLIDPNHPVGLYNLGIVQNSKGQPEKAAETWHKILEVAPNSPQARAIDQMLHGSENN